MSFIITVYTNEGIIMASDSRTTYSNQVVLPNGEIRHNFGVQITDTTYKTFICNSRIGLSTCGDATINSTPIAGFIENFIAQEVTDADSVEEICDKLIHDQTSIIISKTRGMYNPLLDNGVFYDNYLEQLTYFFLKTPDEYFEPAFPDSSWWGDPST